MSAENPFEEGVWKLLDGELDEEKFRALETHLLESEEARARFLEISDLHGLLYQRLGQTASEPSVISMDTVIQRQQRRILKRSALAAAALLLIAGLVMSVIWMKQSAPLLTFRHTNDAIFHTTHTDTKASSRSNVLAIGSRLYLSQGTVELTLKNGVQAIVRAPADLGLLEKDRIAQNEGIVRYVVPQSAVGFQVQTPELLVTDLGTEFGVVSSREQRDQVHLFKGKVEIESRKHLKTRELLTGVESKTIGSAGRFSTIDSSPELFKESLNEKPPYLHLSFDQMEDDQFKISGNLPDLEELSATMVKKTDASHLVPGKVGNAIAFNAKGGYVQTNWEGISGTSPRSVAFWCKFPESSQTKKPAGFVAWGDHRTLGQKFVIVTNRDPDAGQVGAVRFDCGRGYAIGETDLMDGAWHHVAVVMGGQVDSSSGVNIQLFVDGEKEELTGFLPTQLETAAGINEDSWMSIGRYRLPGLAFYNLFEGSMDDLYVFSDILTRADIRQIMKDDWESER